MKCYACGNRLSEYNFCPSCGADVGMYKHIMYTSNRLYNEGLEKANVRDLSGAIVTLNESLKYNKMNTNARNLLGLCYFERGEAVLAMSEWIISKNYDSKKNIADEYISKLQSSPAQLDTINQTIKKYNQALNYCYQNSQDLAIIQLKKVLSVNENLISGYQLLALLYMEQEDYEKARRTLLRAIRIDTNDTRTQRYLKEINEILKEQDAAGNTKKGGAKPQEIITYQNGNETIIQPMYVKEKRGFSSIINIIIGLVVGLAICWYLILPTKITEATTENDAKFVAVSEELANEKASHQESIKALETMDHDKKELQAQIDELTGQGGAVAEIDFLIKAAEAYMDDGASDADIIDNLSNIGEDYLNGASSTFKEMYDKLQAAASENAINEYVEAAKNALKTSDYQAAIDNYQKAYDLDKTNSDNLMALAYAYRESGDTNKADELYRQVIAEFSETDNAMDAAEYLTNN